MIIHRPWWKHPVLITLLVLLAGGAGAWLAMGKPVPEDWIEQGKRTVERLPDMLREPEPDRLYCAESIDTDTCRCITSGGERPEISEEECRRRARASETD